MFFQEATEAAKVCSTAQRNSLVAKASVTLVPAAQDRMPAAVVLRWVTNTVKKMETFASEGKFLGIS